MNLKEKKLKKSETDCSEDFEKLVTLTVFSNFTFVAYNV